MINPHLNILVQLAKVDGETDETELELIREIGKSNRLSDEDIDQVLEMTEADDHLPALHELSNDEKTELMFNIVLMMKADGIIHKEEMNFCLKVTQKMGFRDDALYDLVSSTDVSEDLSTDKDTLKQKALKYLSQS
jgi:uncharacterized tellurite resistance protein B-like protein